VTPTQLTEWSPPTADWVFFEDPDADTGEAYALVDEAAIVEAEP
jgi:hypothetical protein